MNFLAIEKALVAPVMEVVTELSIYRKGKQHISSGLVYTLYEPIGKTIKIGFCPNASDINQLNESSSLVAIKKNGSKRYEELVRSTLKELGFYPKNEEGDYKYSKELVKHLKVLGWPIGKTIKKLI
tara:strand:+ start:450 stop:827 length:378 start_codon:yes stop_codon:yes gene_type:complete